MLSSRNYSSYPVQEGDNLVTRKTFTYDGKTYNPGDDFPYKELSVDWRKVTQMFKAGRFIVPDSEPRHAKPRKSSPKKASVATKKKSTRTKSTRTK